MCCAPYSPILFSLLNSSSCSSDDGSGDDCFLIVGSGGLGFGDFLDIINCYIYKNDHPFYNSSIFLAHIYYLEIFLKLVKINFHRNEFHQPTNHLPTFISQLD